jgi:hypothetical protein
VVKGAARLSPPTCHSTVPTRPGLRPADASRAGDSRELQLSRRLGEEHVGGDRHRRSRRGHEELRNVDVERALHDESGCAALDRLPGEVVPVDALTGHAEEERPSGDGAGVVGEVADVDRTAPGHLARRECPDQGVELHAERLEKPVEAASACPARPAGSRGAAG